jgi:hypothetical protein
MIVCAISVEGHSIALKFAVAAAFRDNDKLFIFCLYEQMSLIIDVVIYKADGSKYFFIYVNIYNADDKRLSGFSKQIGSPVD